MFLELTPRALWPVLGKSMLVRNLKYLRKHGISKVLIIDKKPYAHGGIKSPSLLKEDPGKHTVMMYQPLYQGLLIYAYTLEYNLLNILYKHY